MFTCMLGIISLKNEQNKLMKPNSNLNRLDTYDRCMDKNVNSWKLSISGRSNEAWAYVNVARHKDIDNSREITWIIIQVKHVSFYDIMGALLRATHYSSRETRFPRVIGHYLLPGIVISIWNVSLPQVITWLDTMMDGLPQEVDENPLWLALPSAFDFSASVAIHL